MINYATFDVPYTAHPGFAAARNVHSIDVTEDKNLSTYNNVDVGFSARKILKEVQAQKKVTDRSVLEFRMETRAFLQAIMKQLMLKSPLKYSLTKNLSALDPRLMAQVAKREANRTQFRCVMTKLTEAGRFPERDADEAEKQYGDFTDNVALKHQAEFATFDTNTGRVESL